jgi:D-alanine-D-alanine ligase
MGSSVGVTKAHDESELITGINTAAEYDYKVIVEAGLENCHEVECAVLGNENPQASIVGEIVPGNEFYDYQTKYIDDKSELIIPARISEQAMEMVREMSLRAFQAVEAAGLARVDFFVRRDNNEVYINEINTMPGFTPISMYPKLWEASGISYTELIDRLVELALERQKDRQTTRSAL